MGRLYYIDNLRSFALLLGILFHSAIVYAPKIGYAIQNQERIEPFGYFCFWIHSFRMPLFFIISGFFSVLVWEKKGGMYFLKGRWERIFIPMLVGLLALAPIQYFLILKISHPDLNYFFYYLSFFTKEGFGQSHIWFLVNLFLYGMLFAFLPKQFIKKTFSYFQTKHELVLFFVIFVISFSLTLLAHSFFPRGDSKFGIDKLLFCYQFAFFLSGVFIYHSGKILIPSLETSSFRLINWTLFGIIVYILFYEWETTDPLWMPYFWGGVYNRIFHILLWCLSPIIWFQVFVLFFQKWGNGTGKLSQYLIDSSLPVYLIHHPISLLTAFYFRNWDFPVVGKFIFHVLIVFGFSFLFYDLIVRNSIILKKLFGVK
ncbi:acyltransferase family protein [Leptospira sp. 'Mane']|uniref:acyltransferase family protein n=1 Tax=Leptospira sp. 'Mane' TaxID=3387407 RepID=UPI00398AB2BC